MSASSRPTWNSRCPAAPARRRVADARATRVVGHRRLPAAGLVEREVDEFLATTIRVPSTGRRRSRGRRAGPARDDAPVDLDGPCRDHLLGSASRRHPRLGQDLLQPHALARGQWTVPTLFGVLVARGLGVARLRRLHPRASRLGLRLPRAALGGTTLSCAALPTPFFSTVRLGFLWSGVPSRRAGLFTGSFYSWVLLLLDLLILLLSPDPPRGRAAARVHPPAQPQVSRIGLHTVVDLVDEVDIG